MITKKQNNQYETLNPWADADPVELRGISPRVTDLKDKTIGFYANFKPITIPFFIELGEKLKERFRSEKIALLSV